MDMQAAVQQHRDVAIHLKVRARDIHYRLIEDAGLRDDSITNARVRALLEATISITDGCADLEQAFQAWLKIDAPMHYWMNEKDFPYKADARKAFLAGAAFANPQAALNFVVSTLSELAQREGEDISDATARVTNIIFRRGEAVEEPYLLLRKGHHVGNSAEFWKKGGSGYTTAIEDAHEFTKAEAEAQHKKRAEDVPVRLADVLNLARTTVDVHAVERAIGERGVKSPN